MWKSKNRKKIEMLEMSVRWLEKENSTKSLEISRLFNQAYELRTFLNIEYKEYERKLQIKKKGKK